MHRKVSFLGFFVATLFMFVLPSSAQSNLSKSYDKLFLYLTIVSFVVLALVVVVWIWFMIKFNENNEETDRAPISHATSRKLEFGWTAVAILIVIVLMALSYPVLFGGFNQAQTMGDGTGELVIVEGTGNWQWRFHMPDGSINEPTRDANEISHTTMTLKTNTLYTFKFYNSGPYIHSFFVYDLNIKMDVVPGINNTLTIKIVHSGEFPVLCAEYCGVGHSQMRGLIIAEDA